MTRIYNQFAKRSVAEEERIIQLQIQLPQIETILQSVTHSFNLSLLTQSGNPRITPLSLSDTSMATGGAASVKEELILGSPLPLQNSRPAVITISSSESSGDDDESSDVVSNDEASSSDKRRAPSAFPDSAKKPKLDTNRTPPESALALGFLDPLSPVINSTYSPAPESGDVNSKSCKQFWKAGDYVGGNGRCYSESASNGGMDHVRVHPRFLHSNATSHKWVLGAFAELLDNSLDEVRTGATYVNVDMLINKKDNNSKMLLVQDNGGGMTPDKLRQCISLGYSAKSKLANTIGQYGNGFKTSTMRLGADVIVFTCCQGKDGSCPTKSVGLLSYTFLRGTGMEDIVVPMVDFEKRGQEWKKVIRTSVDDWCRNLETITKWSPYTSEEELLSQFQSVDVQGTRVVIYNLWEDDEGQLELDFDADIHDIQIRGVNRDQNKIELAQQFPNAGHFLTYRHSLRSYAAILYLRVPPGFRIILRGKDVAHHNLVNDMIHSMEHTYRPQLIGDGAVAAAGVDMVAVVRLGFVKDAEAHINIQGFNVYHKNRLIKPFWRVWNAAGSDGRGVIGVLEANFIEPAHDKQGFERTIVLSRLESRLLKLQKDYWRGNCHKVGYAPRRQLANVYPVTRESPLPNKSKPASNDNEKPPHEHSQNEDASSQRITRGMASGKTGHFCDNGTPTSQRAPEGMSAGQTGHADNGTPPEKSASYFEDISSSRDYDGENDPKNKNQESPLQSTIHKKKEIADLSSPESSINILRKENTELKKRLSEMGESNSADLLRVLQAEREQCKSLAAQILKAEEKIKELDREQEALIQIFSEERNQRDIEEDKLRSRLKMATITIQELEDKVTLLETKKVTTSKTKKKSK